MVLDRVSLPSHSSLDLADNFSTPIQVSESVDSVGHADKLEQSRGIILAIQIPTNSPSQSMGDFQEYNRQSHQEWSNESRDETSARCAQISHAEANEGCYYQ
jgi:hypothetical protein